MLNINKEPVLYQRQFYLRGASIERTSLDRSTKSLSNSCFFSFVNVYNQLAHQPVPTIYPSTYAEDARYQAAHRSLQSLVEHHLITWQQ